MLIEIKKLNIINEGHTRKISLDRVFVNSKHVISIRDYHGAREFLLSEGSDSFAQQNYSLVKINNISGPEEIIALGTSEQLFSKFNKNDGKRLLND
tara:strand:- start:1730 stop:2017 length:288 start_codon:yes stop_codon:yes gene_type:complete